MVQCVCINCSGRLDNGVKVSLYRIPVVRKGRSQREYKLSLKRRDGFLAVISRDDLDFDHLGKYRICLRHFVSGHPANLFDPTSPD